MATRLLSRLFILAAFIAVCQPVLSGEQEADPTGEPPKTITIKATSQDLAEVAQVIAEQAGINIVVADDISAKVTLEIKDQPWPIALDALVNSLNLKLEERPNGVLFIASSNAEPQVDEEKSAKGKSVTLTYRDRRLGDVLSELAEKAGISIVVESGRIAKLEDLKVPSDRLIDVDLRDVPWDDALDVLVQKAGLEKELIGDNLYIVRRPHVNYAFSDAPIRQVLELIAKLSGSNIVISPEIDGKVTMKFSEVPWIDALDVVVTSLGYTWRQESPNTILVYGKASNALEREIAFFEVRFLRSSELSTLLNTIVSEKQAYGFYRDESQAAEEGELEDVVDVYERVIFHNAYRNILIVRDAPFIVRKVSELLRRYDKPKLFTMQLNLSDHEILVKRNDKEISYSSRLSEGMKRSFFNKVLSEIRPLLSARGEARFEAVIDSVFIHDDAWSLRLVREYVSRNYPPRPFSSNYQVKTHSLLYKDPASIAEVLRGRLNEDAVVEIDPYLNTVSVAASDGDQVYAAKLISVLDIPPENTVVVRVFKLKYAQAEDVAKRINELVKHASDLLKTQEAEEQMKAEAAAAVAEAASPSGGGLRAIGVDSTTLKVTQGQTQLLEESIAAAGETEAPEAEGKLPLPGGRIGAISGNAIADTASNCVIVTTRAETLAVIQNLIIQLDTAPMQVLILAQVLETTADRMKDVGVNWNVEGSITGSAVPTMFPFPKSSPDLIRMVGDIDPTLRGPGGTWPESENKAFPYISSGDFTFGTLSFAKLSMTLKMLRDDADTKLISAPQVATLSNQTAHFEVRTSFEYRKRTDVALGDGGQVAISYETDTAEDIIVLDVTPQITPDGNILMELEPEVSDVVRFDLLENADGTEDKLPITTTRKTKTRVMVPNGRTMVLSGLIQNKDTAEVNGVPGLSKIPGLGKAFKKEMKSRSRRSLVFFITPIIMEQGSDKYIKDLTSSRVTFWEHNQDPWTVIQDLPQ